MTGPYYGTNLFELNDKKGPAPKTKVAQFKEVDPSAQAIIVQPDPEYFYLSSVKVNAIGYTSTPNEYGGITIRIGGV